MVKRIVLPSVLHISSSMSVLIIYLIKDISIWIKVILSHLKAGSKALKVWLFEHLKITMKAGWGKLLRIGGVGYRVQPL